MTFMECPNMTYNQTCLLGIVIENTSIRNQFKLVFPGVVMTNQHRLCLCQGPFFNNQGDVCIAYHVMREKSDLNRTLLEIVEGSNDSLEFCTALFCPKPVVCKYTDVSILYLNQIGGPVHHSWNFCNRIFDECGLPFLESRLQPDSWCNQYISNFLSNMTNISFEDMKIAENCNLINRVNPHDKNNCFENLNMNKTFHRSKSQTDVFFCIPQIDFLQHFQKKIHLVEYLTNSPSFISAVVLDEDQYRIFEAVHKKKKILSKTEHNNLLSDLMHKAGTEKINLLNLSPLKFGTTMCYIISLLPKGTQLPSGPEYKRVSSTICKSRLDQNAGGAIDVKHGFPVQNVFPWPYKRVLKRKHVLFVNKCIPRHGTCRTTSQCVTGCYQNLGWRMTSRANGSLLSAPLNTREHHHYHDGMNKTLLPFLSDIKNRLREEAKQTSIHIGEPFLHCLMKIKQTDNFYDISRGSLMTWGGFSNTVHRDWRDFMTKKETKSVLDLVAEQQNPGLDQLVANYKSGFPGKNLPKVTTCCWCPVTHDLRFSHCQFFVNLSSGTALDISSSSFSNSVPQIGSTFVGGTFEHCTMRPLWVNNDTEMVCLYPPSDNPFFWNFAWGVHP